MANVVKTMALLKKLIFCETASLETPCCWYHHRKLS